jgi:MtrB/PioB family decaheme-associated outer membrane protein
MILGERFALIVFLMGITLFPSYVNAQENGSIEESLSGSVTMGAAGVGIDGENFKFGEYTGFADDGAYFVGDADLAYTHGSYFIDFLAEDLGLDNRNVYFQAGEFGNFKVSAELDQQPHLLSNTGRSSFAGTGGTILTGGNRVSFTAFDQETNRDATSFSLSKSFGKNEINLSFRREEKDGTRDLGAPFSTANSTILPEPVDQVTNEIRASLAHNGDKGQIKLEYFASFFDNNNETIFFNDTFGATGPGLISRDPDNTYQKLSLSAGVNLGETTRMSGILEYGMMEQDENLLAFSVNNPGLALPRQTADAKIKTLHAGLKVSGNPMPNLTVGTKYKFYQTINETPSQLFNYAQLDAAAGQVGLAEARVTQPYDYLQNKLNVFAAYRAPLDTTLKLDYGVEHLHRDFRAVENTVEQTVKGAVQFNHYEIVDINFTGAYSSRRGDEYDASKVFNLRHDASQAGLSDTFVDLRRFDIANRERTKLGSSLAIFPGHNVTMGITYYYVNDDYPNSAIGLSESMNHNVAIDLAYADKYETYYIYYSYDDIDSQQIGSITATANNWVADHEDITNTVGAGANWGFMFNKLRVGVDYSLSQTISDINFSGPGAILVGVSTVDDIQTTLHTLKFNTVYQYDRNIDLGLNYLIEGYNANDFFNDSLFQTTLGTVTTLGVSNPNYLAHTVIVYATYYLGGRK